MNDLELYHFGIKGMKWGERRYQNKDGSLTEKGRKRYGTYLDINDKSRVNIARIRKGEAYRKLDAAKINNPTNTIRIAELKARVRSAKRKERDMKNVDKGSKLAAKGQTITGNQIKSIVAIGSSVLASQSLTGFLNSRLSDLKSQGKLTNKHNEVAQIVNTIGSYTLQGLAVGYAVKQNANNNNIRSYYNSRYNSSATIKSVGSSEYEDVLKRRKKS